MIDTEQIRQAMNQVAAQVPGPDLAIDQFSVDPGDEEPPRLSSAFAVELATITAAGLTNLAAGQHRLDLNALMATLATPVWVDGRPLPQWAELSGYYPTGDGRLIQIHANFEHHGAGVVKVLGCSPDRAGVSAAIAQWDAEELEHQLVEAGMIAAVVRTMDQWDAHPHAQATRHLPLIEVSQIGEGPARPGERTPKVLDCSRVLAGPVGAMTLATHGADVLRVGAPQLPSVEICVIATGFGKRNTFADLDHPQGRADFGRLLDQADIWIDAFRPGALADKGFDLDRVKPGSVVIQVSAFDWIGPWAGRRGFDSIVQSSTGIVDAGSRWGGTTDPKPLPVQALDYATGWLAAFAGQQLIQHQASHGGTWLARLSLLRTRNWLVGLRPPRRFIPSPVSVPEAGLQNVESPFGRLRTAAPIGGRPVSPPQPLGSSAASWADQPNW